jgi:hypothetical protein
MAGLDRRTVLRGLGGAVVALPFLECMRPAKAADAPPRRFALVFAGQSIGGDGWARDQQQIGGRRFTEAGHFIVPDATGRGFPLTTPLQPLAALRDEFSLVSGLRIPWSRNSMAPGDVPPGGAFRDFHGGASGPLLCGVRSQDAGYRCHGPTADQVLAAGQRTTIGSLVLRAQPSWYLSGSSYSGRQYVSYTGDRQPVEAQTSPHVAWQSLFGGFVPPDRADAARHDFEQRSRRSVLDLVAGKRTALLGRVGVADRVRLERHFDEIRALERRVAAQPPVAQGQCAVPADPGADPALGADNGVGGDDGVSAGTGYSGETERALLLADLIHMAFVCDLTRVATLQITTFQSHMNVMPVTTALGTPIRADLHEVGHNGDPENRGQLAVSTLLKWHVSAYAHLLQKMHDTPEGDGTLLDHSAALFVPEGGHGLQLNDGTTANSTHSVEDMVMLVAGRAGGLRPGNHIASGGAHPVQVLIAAMQAAGHDGDTLGEVSGALTALFG